MNPYDAAVLFWYARNSLFFELGLDQHSDVVICQYENLVKSPDLVVKTIYRSINRKYTSTKNNNVHSQSINKGYDIKLSPEINQLAEGLLDKLNKTYQTKKL